MQTWMQSSLSKQSKARIRVLDSDPEWADKVAKRQREAAEAQPSTSSEPFVKQPLPRPITARKIEEVARQSLARMGQTSPPPPKERRFASGRR